MQLIIHRGTKEIGGSCVEIATANTRILVDFGMPLVTDTNERFDSKVLADKSIPELKESKIIPAVKGLYRGEEKSIDAVLISHAHMDHYGFLQYVHPDIPVYMSKGAKELIEVTNIFVHHRVGRVNAQIIITRRQFQIGDITITPYLVDHSAFDALAFLIEADGRKAFYSGDFRAHGRKSILFKRLVENPPENIDCLLMEGSMLGRGFQKYPDEESIQKRIEEILKSARTITFLFASSQNIDRIVSAYKACLKTDSILVIDIYTAYVLDRLRTVSKHIPQFNWRNVRVKFLKTHADTLAKEVSEKLLYFYNTKKIDRFDLKRKRKKILMLARDNSVFPAIVRDLEDVFGATIIYSLWEGYLTDKFKDFCKDKGMNIEQVHTSGHATVEDLKAFAAALKPKMLVPIHTFDGQKYPSIFENVKIVADGESFSL